MDYLDTSNVFTLANLGLAMYERVQIRTRGKALKTRKFLCALTCYQLPRGIECQEPDAAWYTLILFACSDLAAHAPGVKIVISNWEVLYNRIASHGSEESAQQIATILAWAEGQWDNIRLKPRKLRISSSKSISTRLRTTNYAGRRSISVRSTRRTLSDGLLRRTETKASNTAQVCIHHRMHRIRRSPDGSISLCSGPSGRPCQPRPAYRCRTCAAWARGAMVHHSQV
ncbi:MAG: hypothetical protein JWN14_1097 [Chthonomonadales bacterium]|nr:hypothetical protein [Chthonomonadales bacterium]